MFFYDWIYCLEKKIYLVRGKLKILFMIKKEDRFFYYKDIDVKMIFELKCFLIIMFIKCVKDYRYIGSFLYLLCV